MKLPPTPAAPACCFLSVLRPSKLLGKYAVNPPPSSSSSPPPPPPPPPEPSAFNSQVALISESVAGLYVNIL